MRPDGPINSEQLTEAQKLMARIAGVPADRPGLGDEYPKMIYRPGSNPRHMLLGEPLKIAGKFECETALVDTAEEEAEALASGWFLSPDPAEQKKFADKLAAERAKDDEIAELKRQLEARGGEVKRGPGRPPNNPLQG